MALTKSLSFSLGRKRILISNNSCNLEQFCSDFEPYSPMKRHCYSSDEDDETFRVEKNMNSLLETLPQEMLIKVICGVDHDDLKQLFLVSKTVRDASIIAKKSHFAFSTPAKTKAFRNSIDMLNNRMDIDEFEAPKQARKMNRPRINKKRLSDISVALFSDEGEEEEQRWARRSLFMETDS